MIYAFMQSVKDELFLEALNPAKALQDAPFYPGLMQSKQYFNTLGEVTIRSRMYEILEQLYNVYGLEKYSLAKQPRDTDAERCYQVFMRHRYYSVFDPIEFITTWRKINRNASPITIDRHPPAYVLSPNGNLQKIVNATDMSILRAIYGACVTNQWSNFPTVNLCGAEKSYVKQTYFIYQPEPELWIAVATHFKPSYSKCRFYAYEKYKDSSVLTEPFLRELVNDPFRVDIPRPFTGEYLL